MTTNRLLPVDPASLTSEQRLKMGITTLLPKNITESLAAVESDISLQELLGKSLVSTYATVKRAEKEMLDRMDQSERGLWLLERY